MVVVRDAVEYRRMKTLPLAIGDSYHLVLAGRRNTPAGNHEPTAKRQRRELQDQHGPALCSSRQGQLRLRLDGSPWPSR